MKVVILEVCKKELSCFPEEILGELVDALTLLSEGVGLSMPLSKAMPSIGKKVHEIRLKDKAGIYRVFYVIKKGDAIYAVHAFQKKTQKTPKKNIDLVRKRIGRL
ncbi:type II toxin-antitoxin system RelE/ParE family toxin [bacterium]|nr:type II toxin-antitoxin system RelE/ParE family toxin [bacterium]